MFQMKVRETVLVEGKMYSVEVDVDVKDNYPWITTVNINGKQFGPMLMKNYPTNKEEEGIVFEVFADKKDRREYCEDAVNNTFVVLQSGKRVRAVDFYEL